MMDSPRTAHPGPPTALDLGQRSTRAPGRPVQSNMYPHKHHSAPQSPPYREGDAQKPSLPPLKM
ncbi:hypothetical protein LTR32_002342, partial [Rachicladosporium monterosium]